jgi:LacI family gluconate utilization system Gnt-I transcriptional repressor
MADEIDNGTRQGPSTLASVARRVGVSVNTVSRALRAPNTVRTELRREIAKAMEELNYVPNRLAGGLAGTRSDIVGVVVTSLYYSEFAAIVDTLQSALLAGSLQVMLANTRYDADQELKLVRSILSWRPAAVAIIGVDHHPKVDDLLRRSGVPVVEMWDIGGEVIDSAVGLDHVAVGAAQAGHLADCGYRRFAFLGSMRENDARAQKRARGIREFAAARGLEPVVVATRQENGHPDLGEALTFDLLERHPDIDGIVCNSDVIAFGALRALRRLGKTIPEEIGLIGFGDSEASACMSPALTTIRPDREAIGRLTADTLLARIGDGPPQTIRVEWRLMQRGTTRSIERT